MFAANAIKKAATVAVRTEGSRRGVAVYSDVVVAPPKNRVSFTEKLIHGFFLSVGLMAYPIYTMTEMAKIKSEEYAAMEIPEEWQAWKERQQK